VGHRWLLVCLFSPYTSSKLKWFEANRRIAAAFRCMKFICTKTNVPACSFKQLVAHGPFSRNAAFTIFVVFF
jgi:hypothetical protein